MPITRQPSRAPGRFAAAAISARLRIASGVSIIAHSRVRSSAPALASACVALSMSAPLQGFGTSTASGPAAAAAFRSASPQAVSRALMRMTTSRRP